MKQVIFTADDFGLTPEVNEAVELAHRRGTLSAASLMVAAPAAADAIARARALPSLRVGLHLTLVDGQALLPSTEIPTLADETGALPRNLVAAGVRWFFSPRARRDVTREVRAQFEAFRASGLVLDHVNAHNHMHLHPTVLGCIIALAREFGSAPVRLPWEAPAGALTPWLALMRARLRRARLRHNDALVGLSASGHFTVDRALEALDRLKPGVTEFYFHPASRNTTTLATVAPGYDHVGDFATLISNDIAAKLASLGLKPLGFRDLI